ncbi:ABC transporter ATP-binding protein [Anaerocolumna sp.]|uniref:ABC transporter ATP-binding protein n=1 Tax=Anaerocolumna sp. TaxID=2041569 RepID=UPI0028A6C3DA|nr:ABC transporter ATP-binding protein [Anaerocolumna sp.]
MKNKKSYKKKEEKFRDKVQSEDEKRSVKEDFAVAIHFLKLVFKIQKSYIPLMLISAVFQAATPFFGIIIPRYIIEELMGQKRMKMFILFVGILVIGNGCLNLINKFFGTKVELANIRLINGFELHLGKHIMNMDFEKLEDPKILDMKEQAIFPIHNQDALRSMIESLIAVIRISITILGLAAIIAILNPIIIALIISIVLINGIISKKAQRIIFRFFQQLIPLNRRFIYYADLVTDFSMAKDIRIYNMAPYIGKKIHDYSDESVENMATSMNITAKYLGLGSVTLPLEMLLIYGYMVYQVVLGSISIGEFSMYISAGNNFTNYITEFIQNIVQLRQMCLYLDTYLKFEKLPSKGKTGTKDIESVLTTQSNTIEFRHVYFKYPRSEEYTLKDVNITIHNGEKLSVVGPNGAGKTTFIKLLCRLYIPDKGEILLNGVNINEYSYDEYMKLLSVVFQDYKLFSFTIKENIVFDKASQVPEETISKALEKVGLLERIEELEKGINTSLYKNFDKNGIELSGGQAQKLAIARAVYKNAPIVVLDEPTAALDPYAEYEIYTSFNKLIGDHTAIYISHRLSSCKFCNKVAVFDEGELKEYGTHQELVNKNGMYSKLWTAQAQYYM